MNTRSLRRLAALVSLAFAVSCGAWVEVEAQRRPAKRSARRAAATKRRARRARPVVIAPPRSGAVVLGDRNVGPGPLSTGAPAGPVPDDGPPPPPPGSNTETPRRVTTISGGVLNGKAISKPATAYPAIARAARAQGSVTVQVLIDEEGKVISAVPVSGHPLLQQSAASAVRQWRFTPTRLSGQPVKVSGVVIINYALR